VTEMNQNAI